MEMRNKSYDYRLPEIKASRDKNSFYYKRIGGGLAKEISLECEEWRHKTKDEEFSLFTYIKNTPGVMEGSIQVRIDANNIIEPIIKDFKLRISVEERSVYSAIMEMAHEFIQDNKDKVSLGKIKKM